VVVNWPDARKPEHHKLFNFFPVKAALFLPDIAVTTLFPAENSAFGARSLRYPFPAKICSYPLCDKFTGDKDVATVNVYRGYYTAARRTKLK